MIFEGATRNGCAWMDEFTREEASWLLNCACCIFMERRPAIRLYVPLFFATCERTAACERDDRTQLAYDTLLSLNIASLDDLGIGVDADCVAPEGAPPPLWGRTLHLQRW